MSRSFLSCKPVSLRPRSVALKCYELINESVQYRKRDEGTKEACEKWEQSMRVQSWECELKVKGSSRVNVVHDIIGVSLNGTKGASRNTFMSSHPTISGIAQLLTPSVIPRIFRTQHITRTLDENKRPQLFEENVIRPNYKVPLSVRSSKHSGSCLQRNLPAPFLATVSW